jgi:hypothetical protein
MSNPKGPWVPLSESDVGEWLPWAEYRRRITPAEPVPVTESLSKDAATEETSQAAPAESLPDDAGRRLVAGEPMAAAEMMHALTVARECIQVLRAERGAAKAEVERHRMTSEEREAVKGGIWACEDLTYGRGANQAEADTLRKYLDRTKETE